jgi:hypothetical protein
MPPTPDNTNFPCGVVSILRRFKVDGFCFQVYISVFGTHAPTLKGRDVKNKKSKVSIVRSCLHKVAMLFALKTFELQYGRSYQLEDLVGKEPVFLNDFGYDDDAKKWMYWTYLKRFLEGGDVPVARPKNRSGNVSVKNDAPVFLTTPQDDSLWRRKRVGEFETEQMRCRITCLRLHYAYLDAEREVEPCGQRGARLYLEGRLEDFTLPTTRARQANSERSAVAVIQTMQDIKR